MRPGAPGWDDFVRWAESRRSDVQAELDQLFRSRGFPGRAPVISLTWADSAGKS